MNNNDLETIFSSTASAIKSKSGDSSSIKPTDFASRINDISTGSGDLTIDGDNISYTTEWPYDCTEDDLGKVKIMCDTTDFPVIDFKNLPIEYQYVPYVEDHEYDSSSSILVRNSYKVQTNSGENLTDLTSSLSVNDAQSTNYYNYKYSSDAILSEGNFYYDTAYNTYKINSQFNIGYNINNSTTISRLITANVAKCNILGYLPDEDGYWYGAGYCGYGGSEFPNNQGSNGNMFSLIRIQKESDTSFTYTKIKNVNISKDYMDSNLWSSGVKGIKYKNYIYIATNLKNKIIQYNIETDEVKELGDFQGSLSYFVKGNKAYLYNSKGFTLLDLEAGTLTVDTSKSSYWPALELDGKYYVTNSLNYERNVYFYELDIDTGAVSTVFGISLPDEYAKASLLNYDFSNNNVIISINNSKKTIDNVSINSSNKSVVQGVSGDITFNRSTGIIKNLDTTNKIIFIVQGRETNDRMLPVSDKICLPFKYLVSNDVVYDVMVFQAILDTRFGMEEYRWLEMC